MIERRFRGPPDSGHGGYTCGTLAGFVEAAPAVEVTLRRPAPLDKALAVTLADGGVELHDDDIVIAEARPSPAPDLVLPDPVSLEEAEEAQRRSPLHERHAFPACFVCGPDREPGDGQRVMCGPVRGRQLVASPWEVHPDLCGENGRVLPRFMWAVLDCPSGIAPMFWSEVKVPVLGRLTAVVEDRAREGDRCIAMAWPIEREGRKLHTASAIRDRTGATLAVARATWIELRDQP